jgi:endonuclease/exonuclease/phosphatase family metal-dependent hydrolase
MSTVKTETFSFVSYNIHGCVGTDGKYDPGRIVNVMKELKPDVFALQEVDSRYHPGDGPTRQLDYLAAATNMVAIPGATIMHQTGDFGNAILSRLPVTGIRKADVSVNGREPRGVLDVDVDAGGVPLRVIVVHFGLNAAERHYQVKKILALIETTLPQPLIILGDFNEWKSFGLGSTQKLNRVLGRSDAPATFPSKFPLLALDRIWAHPKNALKEIDAHKSAASRIASDHLPLRAVIRF